MSLATASLGGGFSDLAAALATVVGVPLVVLALGRAFDAVMRAWNPAADPEDRVDWPEERE